MLCNMRWKFPLLSLDDYLSLGCWCAAWGGVGHAAQCCLRQFFRSSWPAQEACSWGGHQTDCGLWVRGSTHEQNWHRAAQVSVSVRHRCGRREGKECHQDKTCTESKSWVAVACWAEGVDYVGFLFCHSLFFFSFFFLETLSSILSWQQTYDTPCMLTILLIQESSCLYDHLKKILGNLSSAWLTGC